MLQPVVNRDVLPAENPSPGFGARTPVHSQISPNPLSLSHRHSPTSRFPAFASSPSAPMLPPFFTPRINSRNPNTSNLLSTIHYIFLPVAPETLQTFISPSNNFMRLNIVERSNSQIRSTGPFRRGRIVILKQWKEDRKPTPNTRYSWVAGLFPFQASAGRGGGSHQHPASRVPPPGTMS